MKKDDHNSADMAVLGLVVKELERSQAMGRLAGMNEERAKTLIFLISYLRGMTKCIKAQERTK